MVVANIVVRSLGDQAYDIVKQLVLTGELAPGAPVRQDTLAEGLGVSKIPLREALSRLEQDGLLRSYPNRGYVVQRLSPDEADEVFALRLKLEPQATAAACLAASPADRATAALALQALETELLHGAGALHVGLNRAFHMALLRPGKALVTFQLLDHLHVLAERYVRVHLAPLGRHLRASDEHRALLAAWVAGDAEAVEALSAAHVQGTLDDLRQELQPSTVEDAPSLPR